MSILNLLNEEQRAAVQKVEGPVVVFAGAGTGKTKTLTARIVHMVEDCNIKPYNILAITFTKKATNEMRSRLEDLLEESAKHLNISTIHSLCVKILRRHIDHLDGYKRNFEIIDDEDAQKILSDIAKKLDEKIMATARAVQGAISNYKNGVQKLPPAFELVYEQYEKHLKRENMLDFDDLLLKTKELFITDKEVLEYYQDYYKYILVDEFQDTNVVQYDIIKMLGAKYKNVFVVGDDDQSIYSFRGATVENMLHFKDDFEGVAEFTLTKNYRSHNSILKGANSVIACNVNRKEKSLKSDIDGSYDEDVIVKEATSSDTEVRYVVNEISHLVSNKECDYKDICVLYRNGAISYNFEKALLEDHIPYNIYGGFAYLKRKEIKDVISYFRMVCNPNRISHFKRIINLEARGVGEKTVLKIQEIMNEKGIGLFETIDDICQNSQSAKNQALIDFKEEIKDLLDHVEKMSLSDFFDYLMERTDYLTSLKYEDAADHTNRVENVLEFKSILSRMETDYEGSGLSQAEKINFGIDELLLAQSVESNENNNAVTLSTVHSVKGLEFDVVFVVALEEGIFPSIKDDTNIEEERRIAYVAFTRAKSKIYLTCATERIIYGRRVRNSCSRFIQEYLTDKELSSSIEETRKIAENGSGSPLKVGAKVNHKYFGYGTVVSVDSEFVNVIFEKDRSLRKIRITYPDMKVIS